MCCALGRRALSNESRRSAGASAMVDPDLLARHLDRVLDDATIPELPNHYRGKVRDNYDLPDGPHGPRRVLIATDRLSAFDRNIAAIPFKGQVLTQIARFWFDRTADLCPNHVIEYPDPNVLVCRRLDILPVEVVVRDYLAGTTATSFSSIRNTNSASTGAGKSCSRTRSIPPTAAATGSPRPIRGALRQASRPTASTRIFCVAGWRPDATRTAIRSRRSRARSSPRPHECILMRSKESPGTAFRYRSPRRRSCSASARILAGISEPISLHNCVPGDRGYRPAQPRNWPLGGGMCNEGKVARPARPSRSLINGSGFASRP